MLLLMLLLLLLVSLLLLLWLLVFRCCCCCCPPPCPSLAAVEDTLLPAVFGRESRDSGEGEKEVISASTDEMNSSSRSSTSSHDILTLVIDVALLAERPQGDVDDGIIFASFVFTPCDLR